MEKSSTHGWDWLSAGLLFLMLQVTAGRLMIANWAPFLYFAETLATFGTILGLALGTSRFNRHMVTWIVIGYTAMVLPWQWTAVIQSDIDFRERLYIVASRLAIAFVQFIQRVPINIRFSLLHSYR